MKVSFVDLGAQYSKFRQQFVSRFEEISLKGAYILSDEVASFEQSFSRYCETKFAVAVGNGTDAIFLPMKAMGVGPNDEVITAPNSFIATAGAIVMLGAKPVFVDVGSDYNLDPNKLRKAITKKTKAILPVHLTGMPCDMEPILEIARQNDLLVFEDCAQAVGATYKKKKVGSFGNAGCFSLHPLKNLHVHGDGGVVTTNDETLYAYIKKLSNHGLKNRDECDFWGYNSRLDSVQAAIASIKLQHLDEITARFRDIAKQYHDGLANVVQVPEFRPEREGVFHNFVIEVDNRTLLQRYLLEKGIETKVHYPIPIHLQKAAASLGYKQGDFPVAERQAQKILSLPVYSELTSEQVEYVIDTIRGFFK